jgi:hypothetical protein
MATPMEDRVRELEGQVSTLREDRAAYKVEIQNLRDDVKDLRVVMKDLVSTIDKSKGALWLIGGASAFLGALGHYAAVMFTGGPNH